MRLCKVYLFVFILYQTSCAFNIELTSQRTALENQIMGVYQALEDDLVLMGSVRGISHATNIEFKTHITKKMILLAQRLAFFESDRKNKISDKLWTENTSGKIEGKADLDLIKKINKTREMLFLEIAISHGITDQKSLKKVAHLYHKHIKRN